MLQKEDHKNYIERVAMSLLQSTFQLLGWRPSLVDGASLELVHDWWTSHHLWEERAGGTSCYRSRDEHRERPKTLVGYTSPFQATPSPASPTPHDSPRRNTVCLRRHLCVQAMVSTSHGSLMSTQECDIFVG